MKSSTTIENPHLSTVNSCMEISNTHENGDNLVRVGGGCQRRCNWIKTMVGLQDLTPDHQMIGADLSLVTVGRSLTVAKGFPPPRKGGLDIPFG